jgi:molybdopterin-containing oxidoreductase family membrane subunit
MLDRALVGSQRYWAWIILLLAIAGVGFLFYLQQWSYGLGITGLSRDVPWGLYIANFNFLVGVAASAVMVVLPYYLHKQKAFGKLTILGEFLAVAAVVMCLLFIFLDQGQPKRIFHVILYPSPNSMLFWDMVSLNGYLLLNMVIGWSTLSAERKSEPPRAWVRPLALLSIPWAFSIHTVTAFIYSGLAGRPFWLTAIMAPRFLASAFASGPALLILICLIMRRLTKFDPGKEALEKVAQIATYATVATVFFMLLEIFTVYYPAIPAHRVHFQYLLFGVQGKASLVPWMWTSILLACVALALLINPRTRQREDTLMAACGAVVGFTWIDKGLGLLVAGFIPSPTGEILEYWPTLPEVWMTLGVWALGFLLLTILYKITISVKAETPTIS